MPNEKFLFVSIEVSFAFAACSLSLVLADVLPAERPTLGRRGEQRTRSLAESALGHAHDTRGSAGRLLKVNASDRAMEFSSAVG